MNNDLLFSKSHQTKLLKNVEAEYHNFIQDVRDDLKNGFTTDVVDPQFLDQLNDIIHDEIFDQYSPLKFYWMNMLDNLIYIIQLHEEILNSEEYNEGNDELSPIEEELHHLWQNSDMASTFEELLEEGLPVLEASDQLLPLLENQLISFYVIHINQFQQEFDDAIIYQTNPEIGDFDKRIYIGDQHQYIELDSKPESFPSIPVKAFRPQKNEMTIEIKEEDVAFKIKELKSILNIENKSMTVVPSCEMSVKKEKHILDMLENSFKLLKSISTELYDSTLIFTKTIIPTFDEAMLGHSLQSLPGFSTINFASDLKHEILANIVSENANHYLHTHLNQGELVHDNNEEEYFSPWNKSPSSIKEIYHDVFTNYFVFELGIKALKANHAKKIKLSKDETLFFQTSMLEKSYQLDFSKSICEKAYKNKRINKAGFEILSQIFKNLESHKKIIQLNENELQNSNSEAYEEVLGLKIFLEKNKN